MPKPLEKRERNREYDSKRKAEYPWRAWYGTERWKRLRTAQKNKQPLCERCLSKGLTTIATVAHHIVPHKGDPILFWDPNNLSSSCAPCHDIDEQRIERGGRARQDVGPDGWPIDG